LIPLFFFKIDSSSVI